MEPTDEPVEIRGSRLHVDAAVDDIEDATDAPGSQGNELYPVTEHDEDRG